MKKGRAMLILVLFILFSSFIYAKASIEEEQFWINSIRSMEKNECVGSGGNIRAIENTLTGFGLNVKSSSTSYKLRNGNCVPSYSFEFNDDYILYVNALGNFNMKKIERGFAVDPISIENEVTVVYRARGSALYKCKDWDFANSQCNGRWELYMETTPGDVYVVKIKGRDPGFIELIPSSAIDSNGNDVTIQVSYQDNLRATSNFFDTNYYVNATFNPGYTQAENISYAEVACRIYGSGSSTGTTLSINYFNYSDAKWYPICAGTITLTTTPITYYCNATSFFNINKSVFTYQCNITLGSFGFFPPRMFVDWMYLGLRTNKTNACGRINESGFYSVEGNTSSRATCFIIDAPNVTLDCNGNTIKGEGVGVGVYIRNQSNVSVRNCRIEGFAYGIAPYFTNYNASNRVVIENVSLKNNSYGVYGANVLNSILRNLEVKNSTIGFYVHIFDNSTLNSSKFYNNSLNDIWLNWTWDANISNVEIEGNGSDTKEAFRISSDSRRINITNMSIYDEVFPVNISGVSLNISFKSIKIGHNRSSTYVLWESVFSNDTELSNRSFKIGQYIVSLNSSIAKPFNRTANLSVKGDCSKIFLLYPLFTNSFSIAHLNGEPINQIAMCKGNRIETVLSSFSTYVLVNLSQCGYLSINNASYNLTNNLTGNKSNGVCLTITAENLSIEGNGYKISGNVSGTTYGIATSGGNKNIEIRNISIENYFYGVNLYNVSKINVSYVEMRNNSYGINIYRAVPRYENTSINIWEVNIRNFTNGIVSANSSFSFLENISIENGTNSINLGNASNLSLKNINIKNVNAGIRGELYDSEIRGGSGYNISGDYLYSLYLKNVFYGDVVVNISNTAFSITGGENISIENITSDNVTQNYISANTIRIFNSTFLNMPSTISYGVYVRDSLQAIIKENYFERVYYGLRAINSRVIVENNTFKYFNLSAIAMYNSPFRGEVINNTIFNSTRSASNGMYLYNITKIDIIDNSISGTYYGLYIFNSNNLTVEKNLIEKYVGAFYPGIYITGSFDIVVRNNELRDLFYGIMSRGSNASIINNIINRTNNTAIILENSPITSYIVGNRISNISTVGVSGIQFFNKNNSWVFDNIVENVDNGISLFGSSGNVIYNNIFNATSTNAYDETSLSYWNYSYDCSTKNIIGGRCKGGNYYSNYVGYDGDGDGIGESPYTIFGNTVSTQDNLPLTNNISIRNCFYLSNDGIEYPLGSDLSGVKSDNACITINASNVSVLCNGFTLIGSNNLESANQVAIKFENNYSNVRIENCSLINYSYGVIIANASNVSLINVNIQEFGGDGIIIDNSNNISIINGTIYNSTIGVGDIDYGIKISGLGSFGIKIINTSIGRISIGVNIGSNAREVVMEGNKMYLCSDFCVKSDSSISNISISDFLFSSQKLINISGTLDVVLKYFSVGYSSVYGIINWSFINLSNANIVLVENKTIKLARDFVSLNSSNPNAIQLNDSANISLYVKSCAEKVYRKIGFPQYRLDIVENGTEYGASYNVCGNGIRTFDTPSFTGFATGFKIGAWWNCSFANRIRYNITYNGTTNITNYPVEIKIDHKKYPVYMFQEGGLDIRVVDEFGVERPFYIESFGKNRTTVIYTPLNMSPNNTYVVYVYFGSNTTQNKSNSSAVFTTFLETGRFILPTQSVAGQWVVNVSFKKQHANPVLIVGPDVTFNGGQELTIRVRNLTSSGFEARQQEPSNRDDIHISEEVHYVVVPEGLYRTPDGKIVEARRLITSTASDGDGGVSNYDLITFTRAMKSPVVLSSVINFSSTNYIHTRQRNVLNNSFEISLEPEGAQTAASVNQSLVAWIAIEKGIGVWEGVSYEAYTSPDVVTDTRFYNLIFQNRYTNPRFVASMQTTDGPDSAVLRVDSITNTSVAIFVQEDQTADTETVHTTEIVGYFVFEDGVYPIIPIVDNLSVVEDSSNISYNLTVIRPPNNTVYDVNVSFNVSCFLEHRQCVGASCSNSSTTYLEINNGSGWIIANNSGIFSVLANGFSNTLSCVSNSTMDFQSKITEFNRSFEVRCVAITTDGGRVVSDKINISVPNPKINITTPEDLDIVYAGTTLVIDVEELFGKVGVVKVNISINGTHYNMTEYSPDKWRYLWDIPALYDEGIVNITAYGYDATGKIMAVDSIEVFVKRKVVCEWWNTSFQYKNTIVLQNPSSLNLSEFIFPIKLTEMDVNFTLFSDNGDDVRLVDSEGNLLPIWIEKWNEGGESIIWTKVNLTPNGGVLIDMYYGNKTPVSSASNKSEVFYYSSPREIYYALHSATGNMNITSYRDGNVVVVGGTTYNINRRQLVTIPYTIGEKINATHPLAGTLLGGGRDSIVPVAFAGTVFVYPSGARTSSTDVWVIHSPFGNASVAIYSNNVLVTTATVAKGTTSVITANILDNENAVIKSDSPIVVFHTDTNVRDSLILAPPSTEIYGISSSGYISALNDNTLVEIYRSDGSYASYILNRSGILYVGGGNGQGLGAAIRVRASDLVGGLQRADGDGFEETTFLPLEELDTEYILTGPTQYVTIACPYNNTIVEIYDPVGNKVANGTCIIPDVGYPGKLYFGNSITGSPATVVYAARTLVNASKPIYIYFEEVEAGDRAGEETNILSHKQLRYYDPGVKYRIGSLDNQSADLETFPFFLPDFRNDCDDVNFTVMVVNRKVAVGPFNISFIVNYEGLDYVLDRRNVSSLACGGNVTLNFSLNHNNKACGLGRKILKVIADEENVINESDESNNAYFDIVDYHEAINTTCKNSLEVNTNLSEIIVLNFRVYDNSEIYNITNVTLTYIEGTPALPASCVNISPSFLGVIGNSSFKEYNFTINNTCAPNGTTYGKIKASGNDFAFDHLLVPSYCQGAYQKTTNGTVFGPDIIDFEIVEPGKYKEVNITIYNGDQMYNIVNISVNYTHMNATPSTNIIHNSNLSTKKSIPIAINSSKNQTSVLNLTYLQIPGNYTGRSYWTFRYDNPANSTITAVMETRAIVPYIYDIEGDGFNEWAFDNDNDGEPDPNSFFDNYGDPTPIISVYESRTMSVNGKRSFLIDVDASLEPEYFWDPTYYNNASGLVTAVNKSDANNDGIDDFLIDNDGDNEYERVYDGVKDYPLPDLVAESIYINPRFSAKAQNISITVTVNNSGGYNASNFDVSLFINGVYVENKTVSFLAIGDKINVSFNYSNTLIGNNTVLIRVDRANEIYESNDSRNGWANSNNQIKDWYYANFSNWHFFYGNISSYVLLGNNKSIFYNWSWNGSGKVYVITGGAVIDFTSLIALGRNTTGGNSSSDFDEFDNVVGLNGFSDNTRNLYSIGDGSTARNTTNITFKGINITDMPIAPSSDFGTNFYTGIVWDSSDDTNGEYDDIENEDIVLIAPIQRNESGSFGNYDYEIRVPDKFDTYKGSTYVEIWIEVE